MWLVLLLRRSPFGVAPVHSSELEPPPPDAISPIKPFKSKIAL